MLDRSNPTSCRNGAIIFGAIVGLLAAILLMIFGGAGFFRALLSGIVIAVILAFVLYWIFCRNLTEQSNIPVVTAPKPAPVAPAPAEPTPAPEPETAPEPEAEIAPKPTPAPTAEVAEAGEKPKALDGPRDGKADDLKQIKGIGPKLEKLCNSLGFYHFDQIAGWSEAEVSWMDQNLEGFKGRVTRDEWVAQSTVLAAGGTTDFAKKVEKGNVYK